MFASARNSTELYTPAEAVAAPESTLLYIGLPSVQVPTLCSEVEYDAKVVFSGSIGPLKTVNIRNASICYNGSRDKYKNLDLNKT